MACRWRSTDIENAAFNHPDWEFDIIDLTPESFKTVNKFTNNGVVSINTADLDVR